MGTRHITVIIKNGKPIVAQYGQWDGYFDGAGVIIKNAITKNINEHFLTNLKKLEFISEELLEQYWQDAGKLPDEEWVSIDVSDKFEQKHPQLSRNMGCKIIDFLCKQNDNDIIYVSNNFDFGYSGLWCEFGYVYDLDRLCLDVYVGGEETNLVGLWNDITKRGDTESGYTCISLLHTFSISELHNMNDDTFNKFLYNKRDNNE